MSEDMPFVTIRNVLNNKVTGIERLRIFDRVFMRFSIVLGRFFFGVVSKSNSRKKKSSNEKDNSSKNLFKRIDWQ